MRAVWTKSIVLLAVGMSVMPAGVAASATPQRGSFPGDNGRLVIARAREQHFHEQLVTLAADGSDAQVLTQFRFGATEPSWSADGSKIVFIKRTGNGAGARDIWFMNGDGTGLTRVTDTTKPEFTPSWSPDGTRIAFERAGDIFTVDADGTGLGRLTATQRHFDAFPTWSPDGTRIAYSHGMDQSFESQEIMTMAADGTDKMQVTDEARASLEPSYSPDGNRIAFQYITGNSDLGVIDVDGTDRTLITDTARDEFSPAWAPDGSAIVFSKGPYPFGLEIFAISPDGSKVAPVTSSSRTWSDWPDWQPIPP